MIMIDQWRLRRNNVDIYEACRLNYLEVYNAAHIIEFPLGNIYMCCVKLNYDDEGTCNSFSSLFEAILWCDKLLISKDFMLEKPLLYPRNNKIY